MFRLAFVWFCLLLAAGSTAAEPVTLTAADGIAVYGQYWPAAGAKAPLILAFHQAGSSHAEYDPLAPRLNRAGFSVLAIDQRSGGGEFGGTNRTVTTLRRSAPYDAALADLEAALAWGKAHADGAPVLVLGSSYSAALVFLLPPSTRPICRDCSPSRRASTSTGPMPSGAHRATCGCRPSSIRPPTTKRSPLRARSSTHCPVTGKSCSSPGMASTGQPLCGVTAMQPAQKRTGAR